MTQNMFQLLMMILSPDRVSPTIPKQVNLLENSRTIASSHGLLCLSGCYGRGCVVVLWNVSIRKAVAVDVPNVAGGKYKTLLGFGVCGETCDPKIVKITYIDHWYQMESIPESIPWQVEVFTLSTRAWRQPHSSNLPRKSIRFGRKQVVLDGFFYWFATDGGFRGINLIISFETTFEKFREINLPNALAHHQPNCELFISKLRESLVVLQNHCGYANGRCFVWMMEDGIPKSFTKIFTICIPDAPIRSVSGFRKSGESIIQILDNPWEPYEENSSLFVYEPYSKRISYIGISEWMCSFSLYSYMETLLLLDQPDLTSYDI